MEAPGRQEAVEKLVGLALAEDIGPGDITGEATVPADATAAARVVQKAPGVVSGFEAVEEVFRQLAGPEITLERDCAEGEWRGAGAMPAPVARIRGPARAVLAGERTALNFLGHLSGVATLTARYAEAVRGTRARILDTRKTLPGMRLLEKAAVAAGGGANHRTGLFDAFLVKENHIALAGGVGPAVAAARRYAPGPGHEGRLTVEVECETLEQLREALAAGADRILLDNMDPGGLREAVAIRDREAGPPAPPAVPAAALPVGVLLEASGGVDLESVREIAETGVELISAGALTHSAPALDFSMRIELTR